MKSWKPGDSFIWLSGGALALALLMVFGLIALVVVNGASFFWPRDVEQFQLNDGRVVLGEITAREKIPQPNASHAPATHRIQIKRGNRDLYGTDFIWLNETDIQNTTAPRNALVIERVEWGNFYGIFQRLEIGGQTVSNDWKFVRARLARARKLTAQIHTVSRKDIGAINRAQERLRRELKRSESAELRADYAALQAQYQEQLATLASLRGQLTDVLVVSAAGHPEVRIPLADVVRMNHPNAMTAWRKCCFYAEKLWEFVSAEPRESNTEGGVFPAIYGTVLLVLLMSLIVTPLGVLAALYLREYARQGPIISAVRIAVNNLAGVPSIVYGVFGVAFFIYLGGGTIDQAFFSDRLPTPTFGTGGLLWASLTLALLTLPVVIVATEEGLAAIPPSTRAGALALGATKFETTWRVVLPAVTPAVLTGLILAMARAAGEVAPLMITGVVKLAPALPLDGVFPYLHLDRKFMHLGFHIYDVGFQSPNVDAARPMVYTTTILLLAVVLAFNLTAISIRARLRKKYSSTHL
ncbi:MAG: phosphate ABC transporter permease PstA [Kiritimatiellae bacterium]|nr:phosphate ABC transporter permease PstA [Kiritimatiellia bacterium]MCO5061696.1 phosphate ABC transporter permease PstA [Kiritimatiellia bacterium]MCO6401226.1 phosphate ABC transporter permease PstA [Verrucomicrobiota bacterium]